MAADDRGALLADAEYLEVPVGQTLASVGDPISDIYFPDGGVLSMLSTMKSGHQIAVAAVGAEGMIGLGQLFGIARYPLSVIALVESRGYRVTADRLRRIFDSSETARRVMLARAGVLMQELVTTAACNRVHSHRQRLARWLLTTTDKARQASLPVTHETLAQMVGGPRHAVTVALNELRAKGALAHLRGRIEILERSVLTGQACECYAAAATAATA